MKRAVAALAVSVCTSVSAQNVINVDGVHSRSTMLVTDGRYNSCGLRFVGVPIGDRIVFPIYTWDMNVTLMRSNGGGLAAIHKAELSILQNMDEAKKASGKLKKLKSTWIQAEGMEAWTPTIKGLAGENGMSSMTGYEAAPVFEWMAAAAAGSAGPLLLGVEAADEKAVRIYRFQPKVEHADAEAFRACTGTLIEQVRREISGR